MRELEKRPQLFLGSRDPDTDAAESTDSIESLLWLPPLGIHNITREIDWILGLQISRLFYQKPKKWDGNLKDIVSHHHLGLDENPDVVSDALLFRLPPGFSASYGLIHQQSKWENPNKVVKEYSKFTSKLGIKKVYALEIWNEPVKSKNELVEWIRP